MEKARGTARIRILGPLRSFRSLLLGSFSSLLLSFFCSLRTTGEALRGGEDMGAGTTGDARGALSVSV